MKRVGLALSGGGASGLSHIGVLKLFEENNIKISAISGVSFGAIMGGLYCSGYSALELENIAKNENWGRLLDFTLPVNSFIRGNRIENRIRKLVENKSFNDLEPKLSVIAADLDSGQGVIMREGDLTSAIRASLAIPGIIAAKRIGKKRYVDGSLIDPTGISALKKCDVLVVVDLSAPFEKNIKLIKSKKSSNEFMNLISNNVIGNTAKLFKVAIQKHQFERLPRILVKGLETLLDRLLTPSRLVNFFSGGISPQMVDVVLKSYQISMNRLYQLNIENGKPDIVIKPEHGFLGWVDFNRVDEFILSGEKAAKKIIPKLKRLLS